MMLRKRFMLVADQHPQWWRNIGWALMAVALVAVTALADVWPALGGAVVVLTACAAAIAFERAYNAPLQRAERAAKTGQIERELDL